MSTSALPEAGLLPPYNLVADLQYGHDDVDRCAVVSTIEFDWIRQFCPQIWTEYPPDMQGSQTVIRYLDKVFH